ncbi:MAG: hypothetical protein JWP81_3264 [Ferruginibacter sp.]|nr:hypothetical protein [Ferruginibacter sp.]
MICLYGLFAVLFRDMTQKHPKINISFSSLHLTTNLTSPVWSGVAEKADQKAGYIKKQGV